MDAQLSLFEKFGQVEIKNDRISEEERLYCETQQQAYEAARTALKQAAALAKEAHEAQKEIVSSRYPDEHSMYLGNDDEFDEKKILSALDNTHGFFISRITGYFANKYNVTLKSDKIIAALVREEPEKNHRFISWRSMSEREREEIVKQKEEYEAKRQEVVAYNRAMTIQYEQILDHIFAQLDGATFQDVALLELKQACHNAAWSCGKPGFTRNKAVITFTYMCNEGYSAGTYELHESMKKVLRALSFYEIGTQACTAPGLSPLFQYTLYRNKFENMGKKVTEARLFKKGRVDIRFANETCAREFEEQFLGLVA